MAKEKKFENAINKLQEIVEKLEEGNLDIDKSMELYEEGVKLASYCSEKLEKIENKITLLQESRRDKSEE